MRRGLFIVFEGIDGSGKTTQAKRLFSYLKGGEGKQLLGGRGAYLTEEPTRGAIGRSIREALAGRRRLSPEALQLLFSADRAEHVAREIEPRLKRGITVISDRYFFSTLAYGGITTDIDWLWDVNRKFPLPDIVFLIDVPLRVAMARLRAYRKRLTIFEAPRKLARIRRNYGILEKRFKNIVRIDGNRSVEAIHEDVVQILRHRMS